jgi:hypothetical protein
MARQSPLKNVRKSSPRPFDSTPLVKPYTCDGPLGSSFGGARNQEPSPLATTSVKGTTKMPLSATHRRWKPTLQFIGHISYFKLELEAFVRQ